VAPAALAKTGGQASMAIFGSPGSSLLSNFTTTNFAITISQSYFESLLGYDEKLQLQPKLAEKWELSPDGKTYTFQIRQGLKWSDGQPVTARDVEATVLAMSHPATATNWVSYVEEIPGALDRKGGKREDVPGIQVVDDRTVKVSTIQPSAVFLDLFGAEFSVLPKHILDSIPPDQLLKSPFAAQPNVSTGPFRLVKYEADQYAELERNPNYWGKQPALEKVFIKIMTPETAIVQLEKGELEIIPGEISGELPPAEAERLKKNPDVTVTSYPNSNTETFYPNLKSMFGDVKVRQALYYAIDREAIVKQVLLGYGKVAYSVFPEFSPYYLSDVNKYPYDPARAKQLLGEAGWDASKEPNFIVPTGDTVREQLGTIIQQFLQAVGINAQIERTDFATSVARLTRQHTFDLAITQNRGFNNLDLSRRFHTNMYDAGVNAGGYSNPDLDRIMGEARGKAKFDEQKPLTDQIQRTINQDAPTVMMYYRDSIGAVNTKKLDGAVPRYLGIHRTMANWSPK
jgi:peptide/nickel transport system substrate-binding protein